MVLWGRREGDWGEDGINDQRGRVEAFEEFDEKTSFPQPIQEDQLEWLCEASILHWGEGNNHIHKWPTSKGDGWENGWDIGGCGRDNGGVENLRMELMNSIQDLLKEVRSQMGDLSEDEEDIYTDLKRAMKQDQDDEMMRWYEEELRKILNK